MSMQKIANLVTGNPPLFKTIFGYFALAECIFWWCPEMIQVDKLCQKPVSIISNFVIPFYAQTDSVIESYFSFTELCYITLKHIKEKVLKFKTHSKSR